MTDNFRQYLGSLRSFGGISATAGSIIPGGLYYKAYSPAFLPDSWILASVMAAAMILLAYGYEPKRLTFGNRLDPRKTTGLAYLATAVILFLLYASLTKFCTVAPPTESRSLNRFQVGFGKAEWSLTTEGKQAKERSPQQTIQDWMLDRALFAPHGPERLWKGWTINLAGSLGILTFLASFSLWSFGCALLAKTHGTKWRLTPPSAKENFLSTNTANPIGSGQPGR